MVTLKLKTDDFKTLTRRRSLAAPTQLADVLFHVSETLLRVELDGRSFRLIGVGSSGLEDATHADPPDLADPGGGKRKRVEHAIDIIRARHGGDAILKGAALAAPPRACRRRSASAWARRAITPRTMKAPTTTPDQQDGGGRISKPTRLMRNLKSP